MIEVTFNDINLSEYIRVTDVVRPIGNNRELTLSENLSIGATVTKMRRGVKEHVIKFDIDTRDDREREELKHVLAGIFDVEKPVKITYSNEPDKYYLGIPYGDVTIERVTRWFNRSEIQIIIPDGVAHSTVYRKFNTLATSNGKTKIALTNNGTVEAVPIIRIKHRAENGYIGLVNQTGAFELGNTEEADTEQVRLSEILLDYRQDVSRAQYKVNQGVFNDAVWKQTGTVSGLVRDGRNFLQMSKINSTTGQNAGTITFDMPADSNGVIGGLNDYLWWRMAFELNSNEKAIFKIAVSDSDGGFMYGIQTYKHANGMNATFNVLVDQDGSKVVATRQFKTSNKINENPLCLRRGTLDLKRNDDKVRFYWDGKYQELIVPRLKNRHSAKIHVMFGNYGTSKYANINYFGEFFYRKDFVAVTKDIPNIFSVGSEVEVNFEDDKVWIDGKNNLGSVVDGSGLLTIPKGESELGLYFSSWTNGTPEVTVEFEERWL